MGETRSCRRPFPTFVEATAVLLAKASLFDKFRHVGTEKITFSTIFTEKSQVRARFSADCSRNSPSKQTAVSPA